MEDKNNNLENFFRDKFNQRIEPQDWNMPENKIWDNIASEINKEDKKRRFGILPILLVGASILWSLLMGIDNYYKGKNIAALRQELKECANQPIFQGNENIFSEKVAKDEVNFSVQGTVVGSQSEKQVQNVIFGNTSNSDKHSKKINKSGTLDAESKYTMSREENNSDFVPDQKNEMIGNIEFESRFITSTLPLPTLNNISIFSQHSNRKMDFPMVLPFTKPKKLGANSINFGPVARYIVWQDRIKGNFDNPLSELLVKEETSPTLAMGISVSKELGNHIILNTGLLHYQRNQTSQYAINLPYSIDEEINIGTEFENRFSHSLPTGLGNINTNLVLSRSINSPVTNNENVYLDFSMKNHTKALALPLMLSYYLKKSGDGFFVQGGIFNEFIIQNEIREINTESHHTFVKDKSIAVDYNKSQINKINVSTVVGIGYEKELIKGIGVSLSANYGFELTNTFETPNYQHKINQLGVQMTVVKRID